MPLVWITLIVLRISNGAHKVCSMEGLPPNFKNTLFNSTGSLMWNPLILLSYANSHRRSAHCHVTILKLLYLGKEVSKSETV